MEVKIQVVVHLQDEVISPWWWWQHCPPKRRYPTTTLYGVTTQQTWNY